MPETRFHQRFAPYDVDQTRFHQRFAPYGEDQNRSMMVAFAIPPASHMVCRP